MSKLIKIWKGNKKKGEKAVYLKLEKHLTGAMLIATNKAGERQACIGQFRKDGLCLSSNARNRLSEKDYNTSATKWNEDGSLRVVE